jgi:hypothetical protein
MPRPRSKYDRQRRLHEIGQAMLVAMALKTVVCNSGHWNTDESNARCTECGRPVWCDPLFEGAPVKYCVACGVAHAT